MFFFFTLKYILFILYPIVECSTVYTISYGALLVLMLSGEHFCLFWSAILLLERLEFSFVYHIFLEMGKQFFGCIHLFFKCTYLCVFFFQNLGFCGEVDNLNSETKNA